MAKVILKKAEYDYESLRPVVFDIIESTGKNLIKKDSRVIIKPNLLLSAEPEKAITTHPLVVKAVAEYVLMKGGRPQISDSPATGTFERVIKKGGFKKNLEGLDVVFKEFKETTKLNIGEPFGKIDVARDVVEADVVINIAKLKTHAQMLLTLGVKNLFGCIVGFKKPEWHFRTGMNREMFARLLVQIHNAINPSITLIDGILAMEGQGPGKSGLPRHLGVLVGSRNAFAADYAICSLLGINPDRLPTNEQAKKLGLIKEGIYIKGDFNMVDGFKFPELGPLTFRSKPLNKFMRKYIIQKPVADNPTCKLCGECVKYCPAKAITLNHKKIFFNYGKCIRCYCCVEICPHGALSVKEPLGGKILSRFEIL